MSLGFFLMSSNVAAQTSPRAPTIVPNYDMFVSHLIELTQIPAPPFKEAARAAHYAKKFQELGLTDLVTDPEGNVLGMRRGTGGGKLLAVVAHLDTVFPEGTPVSVRREGNRLFAPGIGDDSAGLAAILVWVEAMRAANVKTRDDILFVGTVGEEGAGNLRGVRYLLNNGRYKGKIDAFIGVEPVNAATIVNTAVGSKRYKIAFKGPGGHSYGAFGIVNPMVAAADTVSALYRTAVPTNPKVTFAASVISGGTSVNAIPEEVKVEFDLRSSDATELARIEQRLLAIVTQSVAAENAARSTTTGLITTTSTLTGNRPAGTSAPTSPLPALAAATIAKYGQTPIFQELSTDANIPISMGIPAITIGAGAGGNRTHSLDEYLDIERTATTQGLSIGLEIILAAARKVD
jgi:tripeptide aminopeptidase